MRYSPESEIYSFSDGWYPATSCLMICNSSGIDAYRLRYLASFVVSDRQIANIQGYALICLTPLIKTTFSCFSFQLPPFGAWTSSNQKSNLDGRLLFIYTFLFLFFPGLELPESPQSQQLPSQPPQSQSQSPSPAAAISAITPTIAATTNTE